MPNISDLRFEGVALTAEQWARASGVTSTSCDACGVAPASRTSDSHMWEIGHQKLEVRLCDDCWPHSLAEI